jgi:hypothetical protein
MMHLTKRNAVEIETRTQRYEFSAISKRLLDCASWSAWSKPLGQIEHLWRWACCRMLSPRSKFISQLLMFFFQSFVGMSGSSSCGKNTIKSCWTFNRKHGALNPSIGCVLPRVNDYAEAIGKQVAKSDFGCLLSAWACSRSAACWA